MLASVRECQHTVVGDSKSGGGLGPLRSQDWRGGGWGGIGQGQHLAVGEEDEGREIP